MRAGARIFDIRWKQKVCSTIPERLSNIRDSPSAVKADACSTAADEGGVRVQGVSKGRMFVIGASCLFGLELLSAQAEACLPGLSLRSRMEEAALIKRVQRGCSPDGTDHRAVRLALVEREAAQIRKWLRLTTDLVEPESGGNDRPARG